MFCFHCGKEIRDDATFCSYCGAPMELQREDKFSDTKETIYKAATQASEALKTTVAQASGSLKSATTQTGTHEYHRLGGWLAVLTYGLLIGMIFMTISQVWALIGMLRYIRYIRGLTVALLVFEVLVYLLSMYFCYKMFRMVKEKNPLFLRLYEAMTLIEVVLYVVLIIIPFSSTKEAVRGLIQTGIIFLIWTTYFRKSVRVRTYFGTDEYLRKSRFFKNAQAPEPAD